VWRWWRTTFPIGGSKTLRHSDADQVAIIAAGITLHESLPDAAHIAQAVRGCLRHAPRREG